MTSMTTATVGVTGGVDTHGQSHHAAVIDHLGRQLGDREFPASPAGYGALLEWLRSDGELDRIGIEGTGTYGVALHSTSPRSRCVVAEVDRPGSTAREGLSKPEIIRCLKRYVAHELYNALPISVAGNRSQQPLARP